MKIYAIATRSRETYGHGDFGEELKICQEDAYHSDGRWNPMFVKKSSAEEFLKNMEWSHGKSVVEIELIGT